MARTLAGRLCSSPSFSSADGYVRDLAIVCVGSVWKAWPLLQASFTQALTEVPLAVEGGAAAAAATGAGAGTAAAAGGERKVLSFRLLRTTETNAVGACWKAARDAGVELPLDFSKNVEVLHKHEERGE